MQNSQLLPRIVLSVLVFLLTINCLGQFEQTYTPMNDSIKNQEAILEKLETHLEADISNIPKNRLKKNDYKEVFENIFELSKYFLEKELLIEEEDFNNFLQEMFAEICDNNPSIPKDQFQLFLSKDPVPNASCIQNGVILVNIGIFRKVENESQLAFFLCHEIAHYTQNHHIKAIQRDIDYEHDRKNRAKFKQAANRVYSGRTHSRAEYAQLLREAAYTKRRHSRINELDADEKGLSYFLNTKYAKAEAATSMLMLENADSFKYNYPLDLKAIFDSPDFPFKEEWLEPEHQHFIINEKLGEEWAEYSLASDSIKTHPDCLKRKKIIEEKLEAAGKLEDGLTNKSNGTFEALKERADFDFIYSHFEYGNLDLCLFNALQLLTKYPENAYLHAMVGLSWVRIAKEQKAHQLSYFVMPPNDKLDPNFRPLSDMIQNMRYSEIKKMGQYYLLKHKEKYSNDEFYLYVLLMAEEQLGNIDNLRELKKEYSKKFPNGKYKKEVEELGSLKNDD